MWNEIKQHEIRFEAKGNTRQLVNVQRIVVATIITSVTNLWEIIIFIQLFTRRSTTTVIRTFLIWPKESWIIELITNCFPFSQPSSSNRSVYWPLLCERNSFHHHFLIRIDCLRLTSYWRFSHPNRNTKRTHKSDIHTQLQYKWL